MNRSAAAATCREEHALCRSPNRNNPDYVDIVIHSYRHRFGLADGSHCAVWCAVLMQI